MAFDFQCPKCQSVLRTATPIPAGRKVQCPKCQALFIHGETASSSLGQTVASNAAASAKPRSGVDALNQASPSMRRSAANQLKFDDEEETPRRRRVAERDDKAEDLEETVPARPRRKGRKKKKAQGNLLILLAVVGLGLLLVGGGIGAAYWLLGSSRGDYTEMLKYAPRNAQIVVGMDFNNLMKNSDFQEQMDEAKNQPQTRAFFQALDKAGVTFNDIDKALIAGSAAQDQFAGVVKLRKTVELQTLGQALPNSTQVSKANTPMYQSQDGTLMFMPAGDMVVVTKVPDNDLPAMVAGSNGRATLSSNLRELMDWIDDGDLWVAVDIAMFDDQLKNTPLPPNGPPELSTLQKALKSSRGFAFNMEFNSNTVDLKLALGCQTSTLAEESASAVSKLLNQAKPQAQQMMGMFGGGNLATEFFNSVAIDHDGSITYVTAQLNTATINQTKPALPFGGF